MITLVMEIPQEGINFYKDNKMLENVVKYFVKDGKREEEVSEGGELLQNGFNEKAMEVCFRVVRACFAMGIKSE